MKPAADIPIFVSSCEKKETLEVGVFAGGGAKLTVSFTGEGSLSNYTCETYVDIKTCRLAHDGRGWGRLGACERAEGG